MKKNKLLLHDIKVFKLIIYKFEFAKRFLKAD